MLLFALFEYFLLYIHKALTFSVPYPNARSARVGRCAKAISLESASTARWIGTAGESIASCIHAALYARDLYPDEVFDRTRLLGVACFSPLDSALNDYVDAAVCSILGAIANCDISCIALMLGDHDEVVFDVDTGSARGDPEQTRASFGKVIERLLRLPPSSTAPPSSASTPPFIIRARRMPGAASTPITASTTAVEGEPKLWKPAACHMADGDEAGILGIGTIKLDGAKILIHAKIRRVKE